MGRKKTAKQTVGDVNEFRETEGDIKIKLWPEENTTNIDRDPLQFHQIHLYAWRVGHCLGWNPASNSKAKEERFARGRYLGGRRL
jgi:hypothetical protein